ncbi:MAG: phosphotransferase [Pseudomonadota bacterium]
MTLADRALARWNLTRPAMTLAAHRENKVYRVEAVEGTFALRHHRSGYRTDAQVRSELQWMAALENGGLSVPRPMPSIDDALLESVDGAQFDMLTWLPGVPLGTSDTPLDQPDRLGCFHRMGQTLARLHKISDEWTPPQDFDRPDWGVDGLLGEDPLWGRFWESPALTQSQRDILVSFRAKARDALSATQDIGLIHADMLRENVLVDGDTIRLIDFDDSAFGYRAFDVVTALIKNTSEPDYPDLKDALLDGYQSMRALDTSQLALFEAIRLCTYIGWIVTRTDLPDHADRTSANIARAMPAVEAVLN